MKKQKVILIIGILIGIILYKPVTYAFNLNANNLVYEPDNESWNVTNVSDALDDLNNLVDNMSVSAINLGSARTFNIGELYPDINCSELSENDFISYITSVNDAEYRSSITSYNSWSSVYIFNTSTVEKSYNKDTRVLTLTGGSFSAGLTDGGGFRYSANGSTTINTWFIKK